MPIPSTTELMRPTLAVHQPDETLRAEEITSRLAEVLSLSDEDLAERQPSGDYTFAQRLGWARTYLERNGLLERPGHGETKITTRGLAVLASGDEVPAPPSDWSAKAITRADVLAAIEAFKTDGRDETLLQHGYRHALDYVVAHEGAEYDAKALYGIAYSIAYPDEEPIRQRGLQGGREVNRKLEKLGFEVRSQRAREAEQDEADLSTGARVWLIRAGREGKYEPLALAESVALIGWSDLGEIAPDVTREELKARIRDVFGEERPASLASQAGQIFRFIGEIADGDLVVLPLKIDPDHAAVGRVIGPFERRTHGPFHEEDAQYTRPVEWLADGVPYERFDPDLREAFGQQGTVSEISKPNSAQRIIDVLGGADASAIHLVLKWAPSIQPDTIERHVAVVDQHGAVWWGRQSKSVDVTGLADEWLGKLRAQLVTGSETHVFLHSSSGSTWRTRLLDITADRSDVEEALVPDYYDPASFHSLWVKLGEFEQVDPSEILDGYVLAQTGDPVTAGGLGNQTPLIVRKQSGTLPGRFFILNQGEVQEQGGHPYQDVEGHQYHWTSNSSGSWKKLANSPGARFVYYRPGSAADGTSKSYFGTGKIAAVECPAPDEFVATIEGFTRFDDPVPFANGPARNAQTSIQQITRQQFDKLLKAGGSASDATDLGLDAVRERAENAGLNLDEQIYAQLLAALLSGKHVILTGPPGTAKTTLAQAVAEAAKAAHLCSGYALTTATADWTTYETIGGLRPTGPDQLDFEEGHFLKAIRKNEWLVIDELNRSHFDRAFGQLFTVLSGQPVTLPYHRPEAGADRPLTLVPEGVPNPSPDSDVLEIPQSWRVIATMNVFDKTLLFEMSFALMRRFAFIEVASPSPSVFEALIDRETLGESKPAGLAKQLLVLRAIKDLGPAVFMDLAKFLRQRIALDQADDGQLLFEAFYSYLLPQFEGIDAATGEALYSTLAPLMGGNNRRDKLRTTLNAVLGLELAGPAAQVGLPMDETEDDEAFEQPPS